MIFPLTIASEFCLEYLHDQIDIIELDLFFFFVENPSNEFVDLSGSSSQFGVKMIFDVVITSV